MPRVKYIQMLCFFFFYIFFTFSLFLCVLAVKDMYDYQGRSYLHVPQDVGINLRSAEVPDKCYLPKKQIHVWSGHTKVSRKEHEWFVSNLTDNMRTNYEKYE